MKQKNSTMNYKSVRIKTETYKDIKILAIKLDMPVTRLIENMFKEYIKSH